MSLPYRNYVGSGDLEICGGFNESGGLVVVRVWYPVCLLKYKYDNLTSGGMNARVVCEQLKSQNNWNFNISGNTMTIMLSRVYISLY